MSSKEEYNRRKEQGICVKCGKEKASMGRVACIKCREKQKNASKERREFYISFGYCPRCGKNKLFGDERTCPECLAENAIIKKRSREKLKKTDMDYFRERQECLKQAGLCRTGCGRKRVDGKTYCEICLIKHNKKAREYRRKTKKQDIQRSERPSYGLCYTCGKTLDREGRMCIKCAEKATKNLPKKRNNRIWSEDNKIVFKDFRKGYSL